MFQKKLLALICSDFKVHWSCIWIGDNLNQLSRKDFDYFKSFYGLGFLRFSSEYVYEIDDEPFYPDYEDLGF